MTRPRLWEAEEVIGSAMGMFRAKGFEATTLRDLEQATGVRNGSLYQAFGSKSGLFRDALSHYNGLVVHGRIARYLTDAVSPLDGLMGFFSSTYEGRRQPDPGCLVTNSAIESPHLDGNGRAGVAAGLDAIHAAFVDLLERGRGEDVSAKSVRQAAGGLLALYQGLLVLVRFGRPREELDAVLTSVRAIAETVLER